MRRKAIALLLIIVMSVGTLSGCSNLRKASAAQPMNGKDSIKNYEGTIKLEEMDRAYTDAQREFAYQIFHSVEEGENTFLSPYSIAMALSMLYNGADQGTREEMAKLLGYDLLEGYTPDYDEAANHYVNANNSLLMRLLQAASYPKVKINIANSVWLAKEGEFSDQLDTALLAPARYYYDGDIFNVDFRKEETLEDVNQWVSKKTNGMIDPFLDSFSDPESTRVFLANAVYFNGEWKLPFEPRDTREVTFYGEKETARVDMMHLFVEKFRYYSEGGMQGIALPYGNGTIVMNILIPEDKQQSIRELYEGLTSKEKDGFFDKLDRAALTKIGTLGVPKFELEYNLEKLNDILIGMGMKEAFSRQDADFELIGKELYVSRVTHKARIRVEEWGTEASAATGIEADTTAAPAEPPLNFIVDVPFLFFIRDTATDTILFLGSMIQP